jgi:copper chaperone CopZ
METIKFKTNIKCSACIDKVSPHLNEELGKDHWQVDLGDPSKILTVPGESDERKIKEALQKAGYKAERI